MSQLTAVRAFERIWEPIASALDEAERADAGFDGGEWSGPAHANIYDREYRRILALVAGRFGMDEDGLDLALQHYWAGDYRPNRGYRWTEFTF